MAEKYTPTVHGLLKFSWYDTCWERGIWRTDIFWFY